MYLYFLNKKVKIIFLIIISPLIFYLWPTALGGDTGFMIVQGNSMLPTISSGSLVITKQQPEYHIDDIVSFGQAEGGIGNIIVHRIIDETERGFVIKGDNNPKKDPGFPTNEDIKGKVIFATPYFGDFMLLLRNPVLLVFSAIVMAGIQFEQNRRKKKKEKLRRIRLGLAYTDTKKLKQEPKKPDYKPFFAAMVINAITFVIFQISLGYYTYPAGDMITGFLFYLLEASFASTVIFGLYITFIFGLYFAAKVEERRRLKKSTIASGRKSKTMQFLVRKNFYPVLFVGQFLCMLFIIMSMFHIMAIGSELIETVTCDPTKEIC